MTKTKVVKDARVGSPENNFALMRDGLHGAMVTFPSTRLLEEMSARMTPWLDKRITNGMQPKPLRGEVRVAP